MSTSPNPKPNMLSRSTEAITSRALAYCVWRWLSRLASVCARACGVLQAISPKLIGCIITRSRSSKSAQRFATQPKVNHPI